MIERIDAKVLLLMLFIFGLVVAVPAQEQGFTITPRKVTTPPQIDGVLDDTCWAVAAPLNGFSKSAENTLSELQTRTYIVYDGEALYVAFDCDEPNPSARQTAEVRPDKMESGILRPAPSFRFACAGLRHRDRGRPVEQHLSERNLGAQPASRRQQHQRPPRNRVDGLQHTAPPGSLRMAGRPLPKDRGRAEWLRQHFS